jgi:hypothetical protein
MRFQSFLTLITSATPLVTPSRQDTVCEVAANEDGSDDSDAIHGAFEHCGQGGTIVFTNTTYHVEKVLNTTGLKDCKIELKGTLLVRLAFTPCSSSLPDANR